MTIILHITTEAAWQTAVVAGAYHADSLHSEGFIHCSTVAQVLLPANAMYKGQTDLILLKIEPAKLTAELIYEDCYDSGQQFPHIYGLLNLDAVVGFIAFPPHPDGTFSLPTSLSDKSHFSPQRAQSTQRVSLCFSPRSPRSLRLDKFCHSISLAR